jgi:two-component system, response regulator
MKTFANCGKGKAILMAEDDPDDRLLSREALEEANLELELVFVQDGEELIDYLEHKGTYSGKTSPRPCLILLDLNMPRKDGREALREIKENPALRQIPVVVLTTSRAEEDIMRCYDLGVSGYITKPVQFNELVEIMRTLGEYWFEIVELPQN